MKYQVIIPVYNGEDTIEACISSIVGQQGVVLGQDYSVMVIDDGSTDRTVEIARKFPVKIISLGKNCGRIVARLTGAKEAESDRLVFIDARITISGDLISRLDRFQSYPVVMADMAPLAEPEQTAFDRLFYLVRRRYYGKENYPCITRDLLITPDNFKRAPKGTAFLMIDKDLFIRHTPERTGKTVNDDTLLFHGMVFGEGVSLLRSKEIIINYNAKRNPRQFSRWLYDRGTRFSDFYFSPGGYFANHLSFAMRTILAVAATGLIISLFWPGIWLMVGAVLLIAYIGVCAYLSEKPKDLAVSFLTLGPVLAVFGAGVANFFLRHHFASYRRRVLSQYTAGSRS